MKHAWPIRLDATHGARLHVGGFALAHARAPTEHDSGSFAFAPGASLGVGWRLGAWEIGGEARGAYNKSGAERKTLFGSVGARARWFTAPESELSPYLSVGLDVTALRAGDLWGVGPSARVAAGLEVWHTRAHHRLAIEIGVDIPAFVIRDHDEDYTDFGGAGSSSPQYIYAVPFAIAANWTF